MTWQWKFAPEVTALATWPDHDDVATRRLLNMRWRWLARLSTGQ